MPIADDANQEQDERPPRRGPSAQQGDALMPRGRSRGQRMSSLVIEVRPVVLGALTMVLVTLAGWLYLEQATQVTETSHAILELDRQKQALRREMVTLRGEIARLGALHRLVEEGERLQYALPDADDAARRMIIQAPAPSAPSAAPASAPSAAPAPPASAPSAAPAAPASSPPLWERLRIWLAGLGPSDGGGAR